MSSRPSSRQRRTRADPDVELLADSVERVGHPEVVAAPRALGIAEEVVKRGGHVVATVAMVRESSLSSTVPDVA